MVDDKIRASPRRHGVVQVVTVGRPRVKPGRVRHDIERRGGKRGRGGLLAVRTLHGGSSRITLANVQVRKVLEERSSGHLLRCAAPTLNRMPPSVVLPVLCVL